MCSKTSSRYFVPFISVSQGVCDLSFSPPANTSIFWKCYFTFIYLFIFYKLFEGFTSLVWTKSNCLTSCLKSAAALMAFKTNYIPKDLFTCSNTDSENKTDLLYFSWVKNASDNQEKKIGNTCIVWVVILVLQPSLLLWNMGLRQFDPLLLMTVSQRRQDV